MTGHNPPIHQSAENNYVNCTNERRTRGTRMSPSIRRAIEKFIRSSVTDAIRQDSDGWDDTFLGIGKPGTFSWNSALLTQLVVETNSSISQVDVARWVTSPRHSWIKDTYNAEEIEQRRLFNGEPQFMAPPSTPFPQATIPDHHPPPPFPTPTPSPTPVPASMSAAAAVPDQLKNKLAQLTELLPGFREIGQFFEQTPELRTQMIPFSHMSRAISKHMERLLVGKPYEELHGEQLHRIKMEVGASQSASGNTNFDQILESD